MVDLEANDGIETDVESSATDLPELDSSLGKVIYLLGFVLSAGAIYYLWSRPIDQMRYTNLHLLGALVLFLLMEIYNTDLRELHWTKQARLLTAWIGASGAIVGSLYVEHMYEVLQYGRFGRYTTPDMIAGALLMVGILIATRLAYGWIITLVGISTILFAHYGYLFPGLLNHAGLSWERVIEIGSIDFSGVYHFILQIGATWIFIFVIWAGILEEFGGVDSFLDIGFVIGHRFKSGIAQTAVVSSMIMGSITGSPMANIVVTGSFTIPLMKERGIKSEIAAAIETVASTGGMVLPPIMGSVAFLMASFLGITYGEVIVIAAIPALLFYIAVVVSVHLMVDRLDLQMSVERDVNLRKTLTDFSPIFVSLSYLTFLLIIQRLPPGIAGVHAIASLTIAEFIKRIIVSNDRQATAIEFPPDLFRGLVTGSIRMMSLTIVLAMMGLIISTFNITGVGYRIALSIVNFSGGSIIILLALVMVSSIILGMGMPTPAAYLLTITLVAPAMVEVGFQDITAHFFVFYFAMLAALTPPIALAAAVAAKVAQADFLKVAFHSMKLATPLFILPYVFALNEELLLLEGWHTVKLFLLTLSGFLVITLGLHGGLGRFSGYQDVVARSSLFVIGISIVIFANEILQFVP